MIQNENNIIFLPEYNLELSFNLQPTVCEPWKIVETRKPGKDKEISLLESGLKAPMALSGVHGSI